jgi:lipopolysaccharide transport system permease protein
MKDPSRPMLVIKAPTLNLLTYLLRTVSAAKHMPGLARTFLMQLYRQTVLGWWWLVFRALAPTVGIIAVFQHVKSLQSTELPYPLFVVSGMLLWTVVSTTLLRGSRALQRGRRLFGKLTVPKLIYLLASGAVSAVFSLIFAVVLAGGIVFEYLKTGVLYLRLDWQLLLFPVPILVSFLLCIGLCCFISVAFAVARDARYVVPMLSQFWFYFTPVIYTLDIMPPRWQFAITYLNPLAPLLDFFRWSVFGVGDWDAVALASSILISFVMFLLGARFLMRSEWALNDVL